MNPNAQKFHFTFFENSKNGKVFKFHYGYLLIYGVHSQCWGSQGYLWRVVYKMYMIMSGRYLQLGSVEIYDILGRYDILERYFDISDSIQGKFLNISYEVVVL
jgi:hypothetical protein